MEKHPATHSIYVKGLDDVFILATVLTCLSIPLTLLLGRKEVKQKEKIICEEVSKHTRT